MPRRQIIRIDEERCTGCGECVPACAEGALQIVDGKVRVVEDILCDGLGACLGECPEGALSIEERDAPEFDEEAVERRMAELDPTRSAAPAGSPLASSVSAAAAPAFAGCPGSLSRLLRDDVPAAVAPAPGGNGSVGEAARSDESLLQHWPVQLGLVNPLAPFLRGSDLLIAADCAPLAYRMFHEDFLNGRSVVMGCPKLDDAGAHLAKLTEIFQTAKPRSVTVVHMEVPCCFGLVALVRQAAQAAGLAAPVEETVITVAGKRG